MLKPRETLVRVRTTLINRTRHSRASDTGCNAFVRKAGPDVPDELRAISRCCCSQRASVSPTLQQTHRATPNGTRRYPRRRLAFVLNLDNASSRDAGARMGLRPKRHESGARSPELRHQERHRMLRRLLVQCAQYILGRHGEDSALKRWGLRLAARRH